MKQNNVILSSMCMLICLFVACSEESALRETQSDGLTRNSDINVSDSSSRLVFESEKALKNQILNSEHESISCITEMQLDNATNTGFISMMSIKPSSNPGDIPITYYEALGYDSLVPNPEFARLLNINGELEVKDNIIKILKQGTYIFPKSLEKEAISFIESNPTYEGRLIGDRKYIINDYITFIKTFETDAAAYTLLSEGDYTILPDEANSHQNESDVKVSTRSADNDPDFNSFAIFSANKKTKLGKLIENIIGNTKSHTIQFNKNRRIKGSFYFYNYGVYAEVGVKGWTDKKNWIGWSKVESDELRIGWRNVIIHLPMPDDLKRSFVGNIDFGYEPPRPVYINNRYVYTSILVTPEMNNLFWNKIKEKGSCAIREYIRSNFKNVNPTNLDLAEAFVVATPNELRFIPADGDIIKYGSKSYCHVFADDFMDVTIGWSNSQGFFLNDVHQHNVSQLKEWIIAIAKLFQKDHLSLISGEVYVCARLGDYWKGMKINRKDEQ